MYFSFYLPLITSVCLAGAQFGQRREDSTTLSSSSSSTSTAAIPAIPSPTQPGLISSCNSFYKVQPDDTCLIIVNRYGTTLDLFYTWNPSVGANCNSMIAGFWVCVGVLDDMSTSTTSSPSSTTTLVPKPNPTQPGLASNCTKFYQVAKGDTCISVQAKLNYAFTIEEFESWNPSIGADCGNMWLNYWVCVGVGSDSKIKQHATRVARHDWYEKVGI